MHMIIDVSIFFFLNTEISLIYHDLFVLVNFFLIQREVALNKIKTGKRIISLTYLLSLKKHTETTLLFSSRKKHIKISEIILQSKDISLTG